MRHGAVNQAQYNRHLQVMDLLDKVAIGLENQPIFQEALKHGKLLSLGEDSGITVT